jgi:hypothetical protein
MIWVPQYLVMFSTVVFRGCSDLERTLLGVSACEICIEPVPATLLRCGFFAVDHISVHPLHAIARKVSAVFTDHALNRRVGRGS